MLKSSLIKLIKVFSNSVSANNHSDLFIKLVTKNLEAKKLKEYNTEAETFYLLNTELFYKES